MFKRTEFWISVVAFSIFYYAFHAVPTTDYLIGCVAMLIQGVSDTLGKYIDVVWRKKYE